MKRILRSLAYLCFLTAAVELLALAAAALLGARCLNPIVKDADLGWVASPLRGFDESGTQPERIDTLALGDSVTHATATPIGKTFAGIIGAYNAGVAGYSTYQELELFRKFFRHTKVRQVLLVTCQNDFITRAEDQAERAEMLRTNMQLRYPWLRMEPFYRINAALIRARQASPRTTPAEVAIAEQDRSAWLGLLRHGFSASAWSDWRAAVEALRAEVRPAKLILVLMPSKVQMELFRNGETKIPAHQRILAFAKEEGLLAIDMAPAAAPFDYNALFKDQPHFSPLGHEVIGRALLRRLADPGLAVRPAPPTRL
jgi:hypothetical protein